MAGDRRRWWLAVAVVVALAGVAGCSGQGSASPAPPARTGTTPAAVPPLPGPAERDDPQGATYFAGYWLDLIDYARRTLDPAPIQAISLPSCRTCAAFGDQIEKDRVSGTRYEGGRITFLAGEPVHYEPASGAVVNATFSETAMKIVSQSGTVSDTLPEHAVMFQLDLRWTPGGWRVSSAKLGEQG